MRMDVLRTLGADDGEAGRAIGAAVVRANPAGGLALEVGPADGPPLVRFQFSAGEAARLAAVLQSVVNGRGEEIVMGDD